MSKAGFKFGLQPARDVAAGLREQRELAVMKAEAELVRARRGLDEASAKLAEAEATLRALRQQPTPTGGHASDVRETLLLNQATEARAAVANAQAAAEDAAAKYTLQRDGLKEDAAQVQALDTLADQQKTAFVKEKRQREQRELEDLLPAYFRRK